MGVGIDWYSDPGEHGDESETDDSFFQGHAKAPSHLPLFPSQEPFRPLRRSRRTWCMTTRRMASPAFPPSARLRSRSGTSRVSSRDQGVPGAHGESVVHPCLSLCLPWTGTRFALRNTDGAWLLSSYQGCAQHPRGVDLSPRDSQAVFSSLPIMSPISIYLLIGMSPGVVNRPITQH